MLFYTDWEEKGREKGLQEGRQEDILRILEVRFEDIPLTLKELIERIDDVELLGSLLVQAVKTSSLGEFESALRSMA